jgi:hypothetical protein
MGPGWWEYPPVGVWCAVADRYGTWGLELLTDLVQKRRM